MSFVVFPPLTSVPLYLAPPGAYGDPGMMGDMMTFENHVPGAAVVLPEVSGATGQLFYISATLAGSTPFSLQSAPNAPLAIISPGETWLLVSSGDAWLVRKITGENFNTSAPALAGPGLRVMTGGTLGVISSGVRNLQGASPFVVTQAEQNGVLLCSEGNQVIQIFDAFFPGFLFSVSALETAGLVTVQSGTVMNQLPVLVQGQQSMVVMPGTAVTLVSDGQNFWVQAGNGMTEGGQVPVVYSVTIMPGQTVIAPSALSLRSGVLSFNTSPQSGDNSILFENCQVFLGTTQGVWDVTFMTNPNTANTFLTFSAGQPARPSSGVSWTGSAQSSFSVRLCLQYDATGSVLDVLPIGVWNPVLA